MIRARTPMRWRRGRSPWLATVAVGFVLLGVGAACPAIGKPEAPAGHPGRTSAEAVVHLITRAWIDGDQETLSGLVHPDGLKVAIGGGADRSAQYSPKQAYYFFRNLFRSYRTLSFSFLRVQDAPRGQRVHGLAAWKRRRTSSENVQEEKMVFVLVWQGDSLKLSEITTIK